MNCFHFYLTTTISGALHTPRGAPQKESRTPPSHTHPALAGTPEIHAHTQVPCTPALALPVQPHFFDQHAQRTRTNFNPQHWHLCHMGLY